MAILEVSIPSSIGGHSPDIPKFDALIFTV